MTNYDINDFIEKSGYIDTLCIYDSAEPKSGEELRRLSSGKNIYLMQKFICGAYQILSNIK